MPNPRLHHLPHSVHPIEPPREDRERREFDILTLRRILRRILLSPLLTRLAEVVTARRTLALPSADTRLIRAMATRATSPSAPKLFKLASRYRTRIISCRFLRIVILAISSRLERLCARSDFFLLVHARKGENVFSTHAGWCDIDSASVSS